MGKGLPAGHIEHDITNKTLHEHRKKVGMYITKAKHNNMCSCQIKIVLPRHVSMYHVLCFFNSFPATQGSKSSPYVQEWSEWRAYLTFEYIWLEVARGISAADTLPTWAGLHVLPISRFNAPRLQWATNYKCAVKLLVSIVFGSASLIHLVTGSVPFLLGTLWLGWVMEKWQPHTQ